MENHLKSKILLAGENHQSSHKEDHSKHHKQCVTRFPPAGAVVEHLGRLQKYKWLNWLNKYEPQLKLNVRRTHRSVLYR